jgi:hypothetical protein
MSKYIITPRFGCSTRTLGLMHNMQAFARREQNQRDVELPNCFGPKLATVLPGTHTTKPEFDIGKVDLLVRYSITRRYKVNLWVSSIARCAWISSYETEHFSMSLVLNAAAASSLNFKNRVPKLKQSSL